MHLRVRAADTDRERVVAQLRTHVGAGRLTLDEFSERATAAYQARTIDELTLLKQDLPSLDDNRSTATARRLPMPAAIVVTVVAALALLAWIFVA